MDVGQVLRGLRAAVFAVVCVLLAALGHMAMSDAVIPAWMLLVAGVGTAAGAWCCAGRERGPLMVGLLTVGTQAALHTAFSFGQAVAHPAGGGRSLAQQWSQSWLCGAQGTRLSGHDSAQLLHLMHQQMTAMSSSGHTSRVPDMHGMEHMGGMAPTDPMPGMHGSATGMLAAHLLVALLGAGWLWGGERAAFRLVRSVSARLFAPLVLVLRVLLPDPRPAVRAARQEPRRVVRLLLAHTRSLRGPPHEPAVG